VALLYLPPVPSARCFACSRIESATSLAVMFSAPMSCTPHTGTAGGAFRCFSSSSQRVCLGSCVGSALSPVGRQLAHCVVLSPQCQPFKFGRRNQRISTRNPPSNWQAYLQGIAICPASRLPVNFRMDTTVALACRGIVAARLSHNAAWHGRNRRVARHGRFCTHGCSHLVLCAQW
jgi:hypothetical protein